MTERTVPRHAHPYLRNHVDAIEAFLTDRFGYTPPSSEPEPHRAAIGATTWDRADLPDLEAAVSALTGQDWAAAVHRVFDADDQWDANTACRYGIRDDIATGRVSIASWKRFPTDTDLERLFGTLPPGHPLSITVDHEVDRPGHTPPADFVPRMGWLTERVRAQGRPEVTTRAVFTGYGGMKVGGYRVRPYFDAGIADAVDTISFDSYNTYGYQGQPKWTTPDELLGPWHDLGVEFGFADRTAIDETACPEHPDGPHVKAGDWRRTVELADQYGFLWVCYYDVELGTIAHTPGHRIRSSAEHFAAYADSVAPAVSGVTPA